MVNGFADFGLICFSVEEAKKRIYACSTTTYEGFQVLMSEEESEKFHGQFLQLMISYYSQKIIRFKDFDICV